MLKHFGIMCCLLRSISTSNSINGIDFVESGVFRSLEAYESGRMAARALAIDR